VRNLLILSAMALAVSGCASVAPRSIAGGECHVFHDPGFAVRGKRLKDDQWIGSTQEKGIRVCGWKRPAARPAAWDARPVKPAAVVAAPAEVIPPEPPPVIVAPPRKHHWFDRFRRKPKA
jgi:hypothetical protein